MGCVAKMEEKLSPDDMVSIFKKLRGSKTQQNVIPHYRDQDNPFWGSGGDEDIFKAHPDAKKSLIYKP